MKNHSFTKSGPGRKHSTGKGDNPSAKSPARSAGAGIGFVQHTNPNRADRRKRIQALGGIRRFKRLTGERYWSDMPF